MDDQDSTFARESQAEQIGRIVDNFLRRKAAGECVSADDLLAEHPELAEELRGDLSILGQLRPTDDRIAGLIKRGVLSASADPHFAAELGPCKIIDCLGEGGMGVVLKAYEPALNRTVALKILRPDLAGDANAQRRFEREAQAAAALRHPNIVTIYAVGQERGVHFIAMEYVAGQSLAEVLRTAELSTMALPRDRSLPAPLPPACVREIFRQLLAGLAAAHEGGLIHRDIKPSNLLLDQGEDGQPDAARHTLLAVAGQSRPATCRVPIFPPRSFTLKIADFGLARMRAAQSTISLDHPIVGTPQYMSPEQARGDEHIDHRTDLYSAGVVLYEMLTGRTPFCADTPTATIQRILNEEPEHPRKIASAADPQLARLALALMAKAAEDRIGSAELALKMLEGNARPRIRWLRRPRLPHLALIGTVIALVVVLGGFLIRALRPRVISGVRVDATRHIVEVRYGNSLEYKCFGEFPGNEINAVTRLDVDGRGSQLVAVGFGDALDQRGSVLAFFEASGRERWRMALHPEWDWPDCAPRSSWWQVRKLIAADVDGVPGDELIVEATDRLYPGRVSLIDLRTRQIKGTFWHWGNLAEMRLIPDYFDDHRPAILAWGHNNKLDGFNGRVFCDGEREYTHFDIVNVVFIIDPLRLDGFSPPPVHPSRGEQFREALGCAPGLAAYAFVDLPTNQKHAFMPGSPYAPPDGSPTPIAIGWQDVRDRPAPVDDGSEPWFEVGLVAVDADSKYLGNPPLMVDRHLRLRAVGPLAPANRFGTTKEFWEPYWHVIVQNGQYIE